MIPLPLSTAYAAVPHASINQSIHCVVWVSLWAVSFSTLYFAQQATANVNTVGNRL